MDEVASMVGLGWNVNIGEITHAMRGMPDDFMRDTISRTVYMRAIITMGGSNTKLREMLRQFTGAVGSISNEFIGIVPIL